jgi:RNA polymerase sigma-70 factor, ECF subfamily
VVRLLGKDLLKHLELEALLFNAPSALSGDRTLALHEIDRDLLRRCLERREGAWESFVDRFLGLVLHVVHHTATARSIRLVDVDRDDIAAEVMLAIVNDDFAILRNFRGESSLATYLTIIARRIVVRELNKRKPSGPRIDEAHPPELPAASNGNGSVERLHDRDHIDQMLSGLNGQEAEVIRKYHLEGKSYREISLETGMPENSIGPMLTRARGKMRSGSDATTG